MRIFSRDSQEFRCSVKFLDVGLARPQDHHLEYHEPDSSASDFGSVTNHTAFFRLGRIVVEAQAVCGNLMVELSSDVKNLPVLEDPPVRST